MDKHPFTTADVLKASVSVSFELEKQKLHI